MSAQPLTNASAILTTTFVADTTSLEQAAARSEQIVQRAANNINAILSQTTSGFNNLAASAQQSATAVQQSFSAVNQTAQTAATNVSTIGPAAQQASAQTQAAAGAAAASVTSVGAAAQQASAQVQTGLAPASATLQQLEAQFNANQQAIIQYGAQIANNRAQMASLASQMNDLTQSGAKYVTQTNAQGQTTQVLSSQFTALRSQYQNLGAQTRILSASQGQLQSANAQVTQSMVGMATQTGFVAKLFGTKTNMVATAGTAFMGYDRVLQTALGSMGGVTLATSLLITAFGFLVPKLFKGSEEAKNLDATLKDLIETDAALVAAFSILAGAGDQVNESLAKQAETYRSLLQVDINATLINYQKNFDALQKTIDKTTATTELHAQAQRTLEHATSATGIATFGASDAISASNDIIAQSKDRIAELEAQRLTEEKAIQKNIDALGELVRTGEIEIAQLEVMARSVGTTGDAFARMSGGILQAASALGEYNRQVANFRLPKLDVGATTEALNKQAISLNQNISDLDAAGKSQSNILVATSGQLKSYVKNVQEKIAADAASRGQTLTQTQAQRALKSELASSGHFVSQYTDKLKIADANQKLFSDSTKKAGGGAKAARAAVSEYSNGMLGLSKAIEVVNGALEKGTFDILFERVPAKARKAADELKAAAKELVDEINSVLSKRAAGGGVSLLGESVKLTVADLKTLGIEGVKPLESLVQAYKLAGDEVHSILIKQLTAKREIEVWANTWAEASDTVKEKIKSLGVTVKEVFPQMSNQNSLFVLALKLNSEKNKQILEDISNNTRINLERAGQDWKNFADTLPSNQIRQQLEEIEIDIRLAMQGVRAELEINSRVESVISDFEQLGAAAGKTGRELETFVVQSVRRALSEVEGISKQKIEAIIQIWRKGLHKLPGIWEDVLGQLPSQTKEVVGSVLAIIDTMPGEIGDSLRKVQSQFEKWLAFIDNIFNLLSKIIEGFPSSLSEVFNQTSLIIKDYGFNVNNTMQDVSDVMQLASDDSRAAFESIASSAEDGSRRAVTAITSIGAALAGLGRMIGGRAGGAISGAGTGLALGAQIGSIIPGIGTGIGAAIGAAIGFIGGLFGGGKSELEKAQEKAELQEAKDRVKLSQQAVLKAVEETKQSLLDTASKATELLKDIGLHIDIPDEQFDAWFKDLDQLMRRLASRLQAWSKDQSEEMKKSAEEMSAVATAGAAIAIAINAIGSSISVSDAQIDAVIASWEHLLQSLGDMEERLANETEKRAKKLAKRTEAVPEFVSATAEAIESISNLPTLSTANIEQFKDGAIAVITTVAEVFEEVNRFQLRATGQSAEMALPILEFTSGLSETLRAAVNVPIPQEVDWQNLRTGARAAFDFVFDLFEEIQAENLLRTAKMAETSNPIIDLVNNLFGALSAGRDLGSIPTLDFEAIRTQARGLINAVIQLAEEISAEAAAKGAKLSESASAIPSFVSELAGGIKAASEIAHVQFDAANLKMQGKALIQAVVELAAEFDSEGVEAARKLSESGIIITEFASSLADSVKNLYDSARAGDFWIRVAVDNFRSMVTQFAALKTEISPEIFAAAEETARRGAGIFTNIQTIAGALESTANIRITQPTALVLAMRAWVDGLVQAQQEIEQGYAISLEILNLSQGIEANLSEAALNLAAGASELSAALSLPGASSGGEALRLGSPASPSSSITVHVDARGSVVDDAKLTDKILSSLDELERTRRINQVTR